jgi:hypothetical protein
MSGFMWNWTVRLDKLASLTQTAQDEEHDVNIVCYFRRQDYVYDSIFQKSSKKKLNLCYLEFAKNKEHGLANVNLDWNCRVEQMYTVSKNCTFSAAIY